MDGERLKKALEQRTEVRTYIPLPKQKGRNEERFFLLALRSFLFYGCVIVRVIVRVIVQSKPLKLLRLCYLTGA